MGNKREVLSKFLNGEITREQMEKELLLDVPLIFTVANTVPDTVGSYDNERGERVEITNAEFDEMARQRTISIHILDASPDASDISI